MFFKRKKPKKKKQQALFEEALAEVGYQFDNSRSISIDHETPKCFFKEESFELVFPLRFLRECRQLNYSKSLDFCFRGIRTTKREWVNGFNSANSKISFTDKGRKIEKHHFDTEFYQEMAHAKFTLCPAGDFLWTYRFLEAAMCKSIPIIERGKEHFHFSDFVFYYSDMDKADILNSWNVTHVQHNYRLFLQRHTLLDRFIFLNEL